MSNVQTQIPVPSATVSPPADSAPGASPYVLASGEGEHHHFLNHLATTKVSPGATGWMSAVEFLAPRGFGPPLHCHDDDDEVMIVLDGEIALRSGEEETIATTGATVFLPHGVPHTFQVLSPTARFTTVTASGRAPSSFDAMVSTLGTPTDSENLPESGPIDPGEVARVARECGIEILGPPPAPLD